MSKPIGMVRLFDNTGGPVMEFAPAFDITPLEVALLVNLAVMLMKPAGLVDDWRRYLAEHGLGRHFREVA